MRILIGFDKQGGLRFADNKSANTWKILQKHYSANGEVFVITVEEIKKESTANQHKLFMRLAYMIAEESGDETSDVIKALQDGCLPKVDAGYDDLFGNRVYNRLTVQSLDTKQFADFLERVIDLAREFYGLQVNIVSDGVYESRLIIEKNNDRENN